LPRSSPFLSLSFPVPSYKMLLVPSPTTASTVYFLLPCLGDRSARAGQPRWRLSGMERGRFWRGAWVGAKHEYGVRGIERCRQGMPWDWEGGGSYEPLLTGGGWWESFTFCLVGTRHHQSSPMHLRTLSIGDSSVCVTAAGRRILWVGLLCPSPQSLTIFGQRTC